MKMLMFCDAVVRQQTSIREIATRFYYQDGFRLEAGENREDLKIVRFQSIHAEAGLQLIGDDEPEILQRSYRQLYEDRIETPLLRPDGAAIHRDVTVRLQETGELFQKFTKSVKRLVANYAEKRRLQERIEQMRASSPATDGVAAIAIPDEEGFLLDQSEMDDEDGALPAVDTLETLEEQLAAVNESLAKTVRIVNKRFTEVSVHVRFNSLAALLAGEKGVVPMTDDEGQPRAPTEEDETEEETVEFKIEAPAAFVANMDEYLQAYMSDLIVAEL